MSAAVTMYTNEYIIASNNAINENKYNAEKMANSSRKTPSHKLKAMLKPILRMLRNNKSASKTISSGKDDEYTAENNKNCSIESASLSSDCDDDNSANEELESRIFREINECPVDAACYVYNSNDEYELQSVERDQRYVPVHFARTEAGTFFWTTIQRPCDADLVQPMFCESAFQQPELQYGDRWVQA